MWRDYLPRAHVVGLDIYSKRVELGPRVRFVQGDQTNRADLFAAVAALGGYPLMAVIDDGSHYAGHASASFAELFPLLAPGGFYAIEDIHTSYWPSFGGGDNPVDETALELSKALLADVQHNDRTFLRHPEWGPAARWSKSPDVAEVRVIPGLMVAIKRG
jgi:hypothetical protein